MYKKNTEQRGTGIENGSEWWNGTVHFDRIGPTEKSDPPRKVDRFFRNFSGSTVPIHSVLDRNFLKFWLNGSRPEAMLFGTAKRLNLQGDELNISVNGACINNTFVYEYLGLDLDPNLNLTSHFDRIHKKAAGKANLLRSIRSSIDQKCAETIYKTMILPIFTYCRSPGLGWSDTRKSLIKNIEQRSLKIICDSNLKLPSAENLIKRKSTQFVFDCLQNNVCTSFKGPLTDLCARSRALLRRWNFTSGYLRQPERRK